MTNDGSPPELLPALRKMKEKHPATPDQLIPLLQFVQGEVGYLPPAAMRAIAEYLKVPASHVFGVATFYAQFRFHPLGKNRITVCRGTACHVRGSARLLAEVEAELKIKDGETTPDREFSLETVACLGACALAPVTILNKKVHGKVTAKKIKDLIGERRGQAAATEKTLPAKPGKAAKKSPARQTRSAKKPVAPAKKTRPQPVAKKPGRRSR